MFKRVRCLSNVPSLPPKEKARDSGEVDWRAQHLMSAMQTGGPHFMVTWDLDPLTPEERMRESIPNADEEIELHATAIKQAAGLCKSLDIKSTFFVTASLAERLKPELEELVRAGHQIGCHGLSHADWEDYASMEESKQREILAKSTKIISDTLDMKTKAFRAPRVSTSPTTIRLLEELGYTADSSLSAGRLDFSSSFFNSPAQLLAPRRPYHPNPGNHFKEGHSRIWEIPVSARFVPFTSTALSSFGLKFMKRMLDRYGSKGGFAVYLVHPAEFLASVDSAKPPLRWYVPSRQWIVHGLPFRYILFRKNGSEIYHDNFSLLEYARDKWNADFVTLDTLVDRLGSGESR